MTGALAYLTFTTLGNSLLRQLRRLRQPKYLVAAVVGAAYFWFFVFGFAWRGRRTGIAFPGVPTEMLGGTLELAGAFALLLFVAAAWIFGRERAAVSFTEAETMFLFPAPVTRRTLLHYKLLRSQIPILFGAVLLSFVFRRGAAAGGGFIPVLGWWLVLSTLNLHFIASSFTRERLLAVGVTRGRRIALVLGAIAAVFALRWLVARQTGAAPALPAAAAFDDYLRWFREVLGAPPLGWVLAPFTWVLRPYLAADWGAFLVALGPAVLILGGHYFWVMRSAVAFEEASVEAAAKAAQTLAAMRKGRLDAGRTPKGPRDAPFALAARGWEPLAFLWKSLIALGPLYRLRTWFAAAAILVAVTTWLRTAPEYRPWLAVINAVSLMFAAWLLVLGPLLLRRGTGVVLDQLEMTKSYPLPGWKIITGELLTPAVLVTFAEWLLILAFFLSAAGLPGRSKIAQLLAGGFGAAAGTALIVPPLIALLMCIPLAMMLFFPTWARTAGNPAGGVEAVGQGLILFFGYLIVFIVALLPAAGAGAIAFIIVNWLAGKVAALAVLFVIASAVLTLELGGAIWWLGDKLDRFDLSTEMPR